MGPTHLKFFFLKKERGKVLIGYLFMYGPMLFNMREGDAKKSLKNREDGGETKKQEK